MEQTEVQTHRRDVTNETMTGILARVPADTVFHVVVVSTLQASSRSQLDASYATSNVWKTVVHRKRRTIVLAPAWDAMDLVSWERCTRLVLFVEEGMLTSPAVSLSQRPARSSAAEPPRKRSKTTT